MQEIYVKSTIDASPEPSLFYKAKENKRPLLVGLHTWSYDRFNQEKNMLPYAEKYDFNLLLPEFRGPNLKTNPACSNACASEKAMQDIKDAMDYVIENYGADGENVFLLGASGGGHMALMMAGFCPEYFKSVTSFVPITDLSLWAEENKHYTEHVRACCGDNKKEMLLRSPISYMENISKANVKIFHGKYDNVVPVTHSINFYNKMYEKYPDAKIYLDIFDGGHTMDMEAAFFWIMSQYKKEASESVTG